MLPPPGLELAVATISHHASSISALAIASTPTNPPGIDALGSTESVAAAIATTMTGAVVTTTLPSSAALDNGPSSGSGECQLLGSFALVVQAALGGLALLALVYKRWRERPQRPVKIWFFDASKQVFGSVLVHIANVFMSMLTSGRITIKVDPSAVSTARSLLRRDDNDGYIPNPCSFYLLNLAIDTTVGIPILIVLIRICTGIVSLTPFGKPAESIQSGHYGNPPKSWWWFKQSVIYFIGLLGMKICVLILFVILPWISRVGDWALKWTEGNEKLQIIFVMMLFPLIMNALQYYIIDSFIKQSIHDHERLPTDDPDAASSGPYEGLAFSASVDDLDSDAEDNLRLHKSGQPREIAEYVPDADGPAPTGSGSSSSRSGQSGGELPPALFPKE